MDAAKVQLSREEMALVSDPEWILTKNSIMERVIQLMAQLSERMGPELEGLRHTLTQESAGTMTQESAGTMTNESAGIMTNESAGYTPPPNWDTPKISKGENYQGLPYVVLDYPRLFTTQHILAIRTLFWWGHYFSVTLHLKGWPQDTYLQRIEQHTRELSEAGFHIAVSGDEWQHQLEGNYMPLQKESLDTDNKYPFVKISAKCPLEKWNEAPAILFELFRVLVKTLGV